MLPCKHFLDLVPTLGICLLFLLGLALATPVEEPFSPRKRFEDTVLRCNPNRPPTEDQYPSNYGRMPWSSYFPTLTALCGTAGVNGLPLDVGCRCQNRAKGASPNCLLTTRTLTLLPWHRVLANDLNRRFSRLCQNNCYCEPVEEPEQENDPSSRTAVGSWVGQGGRGNIRRPSESSSSDMFSIGDYDLSICGGLCESPRDCGGGGSDGKQRSGCRCMAVPTASKLELGIGHTLFIGASCLVTAAVRQGKGGAANAIRTGRLGGRSIRPGEEELEKESAWSCPCNASYVSDSCCDSADGIVWESHEMKRGVLYDVGES